MPHIEKRDVLTLIIFTQVLYVLDRKGDELGGSLGHHCELPLHQGVIVDPIVDLKVIGEAAADDVNDAEAAADWIVNILCVEVTRQDVADNSILQEVNARDLVSICVNKLSLDIHLWFQEGANVRKECFVLITKEINLAIELLIDYKRHLDGKSEREHTQEVIELVDIVLVDFHERLLNSLVYVQRQIVFFIDGIEYINLVIQDLV